jgi:adiponectin receptor
MFRYLKLPEPHHKNRVDLFYRIPYIDTGYRVDYSFVECIKSIFTLHNETWNIWTHLLPSIGLFIYFIHILKNEINNFTIIAKIIISINFIGPIIGLSCSALYHTCHCVDMKTHNCLLCVDMGGIVAIIISQMISATYFAFISIRFVYIIFIFCALCAGMTISAYSNHSKYGFILRLYGLSILNLSTVALLLHIYIVTPSHNWHLWVKHMYSQIYVLVALGAYLSRFPEKYYQKFVRTFHFYSHALWHIFTALGFITSCVQIIHIAHSSQNISH